MGALHEGRVVGFRGTYRWLSNFYPAPFTLNNIHFPTVEHAYQMAKTDNPLEAASILSMPNPADAKKYGRHIKLRQEWENVKVGMMRRLVLAKFTQNPELAKKLLATAEKELIEQNTWCDIFWGVCTCMYMHTWHGQNYMGHTLMSVRKELNR